MYSVSVDPKPSLIQARRTHTNELTLAVATTTTTTTAIRLSYQLPDLESSLFDPLTVILRPSLVYTVIFVGSVALLGPFRVLGSLSEILADDRRSTIDSPIPTRQHLYQPHDNTHPTEEHCPALLLWVPSCWFPFSLLDLLPVSSPDSLLTLRDFASESTCHTYLLRRLDLLFLTPNPLIVLQR